MSKQGLATGPLKALAWMARTAGLPALQSRLQLSVVRAFAPSERRESLPLPLSFIVWLVQDPATPPSEALFIGFFLTAVWASLRWGDILWVPPDRLQLQLSHGAILGTAVRTKTTNRAMPFGFMVFGLSGTPSSNWGIKFHNLLRQSLADTLSHQPGRVIDFLPARLGGSDARPLLLDPLSEAPCRPSPVVPTVEPLGRELLVAPARAVHVVWCPFLQSHSSVLVPPNVPRPDTPSHTRPPSPVRGGPLRGAVWS